jgi:hypothetical protein
VGFLFFVIHIIIGHKLDKVIDLLKRGKITIEYDNNDLSGLNKILVQSFNNNKSKGMNRYYSRCLNSWAGDINPKLPVIKLSEVDIYNYEDFN